MSNEEREKLPSEPDPGAEGNTRPLEDAPGPSERPEERLGARLGDTADSVTRELRDLQEELLPPEFVPPATPGLPPVEPGPSVEQPAPDLNAGPAQVRPPAEAPQANAPVNNAPGWSSRPNMAGNGSSDDDHLLSMLAWLSMVILQLPIVSVLQLVSTESRQRSFQRHHAITSLLFYAAAIVYEILATIVFVILTTVTLGCGAVCLWLLFLVPHALGLYYAFQAFGGKRVELPFLSAFARQQGWL